MKEAWVMEFQPVVLAAGQGSRMRDLTSKCPKALLPVGNMPMMFYPIKMLKDNGFHEVIIIVLNSFLEEAQKLMHEIFEDEMVLDFVGIPDSEYMETADSLREIKDKIKRDVLLISCDLIYMNIPFHHIANVYRTYDASVAMFLCKIPEQHADIPVPGPKTKPRSEKDFIGLDEKGQRVLFMMSEADLEDESFTLKRSILKKHPFLNIRSNLTDCHLYMIKKWVVDFVADKLFSSIKGELIPHIINSQFKSEDSPETLNESGPNTEEEKEKDIYDYLPKNDTNEKIQELSTWIDHSGDMADCYHGDQIRCYAYIVDDSTCVRTNTIATYTETNRQIPKYWIKEFTKTGQSNIHSTVTVKGKSQIGNDCLVGQGATIGDKVSVKRSIIGKHCTIGDKVKITNSVILDHVTVGEGCNIQGSVVSANVHINEKCELKDCIVGTEQNIQANSKYSISSNIWQVHVLAFRLKSLCKVMY